MTQPRDQFQQSFNNINNVFNLYYKVFNFYYAQASDLIESRYKELAAPLLTPEQTNIRMDKKEDKEIRENKGMVHDASDEKIRLEDISSEIEEDKKDYGNIEAKENKDWVQEASDEKISERNKQIDWELDDLLEKFRLRIYRILTESLQIIEKNGKKQEEDSWVRYHCAYVYPELDLARQEDTFKIIEQEYLYFSEQVKMHNQRKLAKNEEKHDISESRDSGLSENGYQKQLKNKDQKDKIEDTRGKRALVLGALAIVAGVIGTFLFPPVGLTLLAALGLCYYGYQKTSNSMLSYSAPSRLSSPLKSHPVDTLHIRVEKEMSKIEKEIKEEIQKKRASGKNKNSSTVVFFVLSEQADKIKQTTSFSLDPDPKVIAIIKTIINAEWTVAKKIEVIENLSIIKFPPHLTRYNLCLMSHKEMSNDADVKLGKIYITVSRGNVVEYAVRGIDNKVHRGVIPAEELKIPIKDLKEEMEQLKVIMEQQPIEKRNPVILNPILLNEILRFTSGKRETYSTEQMNSAQMNSAKLDFLAKLCHTKPMPNPQLSDGEQLHRRITISSELKREENRGKILEEEREHKYIPRH